MAKKIPKKYADLATTLRPFTTYAQASVDGIDISSDAMPRATDVPGGEEEPVYDRKQQADIQGNTIPGFNKNNQQFLFFSFGTRQRTKRFLKWLLRYVSSMEEVMDFRKRYRERRLKMGKGKTFLSATNLNVAFSVDGIAKLTKKADANAFGDASFRLGMAARSSYLGDPVSKRASGHACNWLVGGPGNEANMVVIVASDSPDQLADLTGLIKQNAFENGLKLIFEQVGQTLPGDLRGHEHFGFKDGISQPGVRGKLSNGPGDYITPRYIANNDDRRLYFAKPGQLLVWPGQFILGEPRQSTEKLTKKAKTFDVSPAWAKRGSYLVVRRLRQDVPAFWSFVQTCANQIGIDPTEFASRLVGRWPSGAPLMRSPKTENPALGADEFANNHFLFDDDSQAIKLKPIPGYSGDQFPQAKADFLATVCPHFAHIRKVNPRESVTDLGKPEDNLARMILRRGIPFGAPIVGQKRFNKKQCDEERGLMFLCYCTDIEDQFEFLQRRWSNSQVQPNLGGHDPIIGQNGEGRRQRTFEFPLPSGGTKQIRIDEDFVIPTGGGYFFSPTIARFVMCSPVSFDPPGPAGEVT